jgi:hypothetical protein
MPDYQRLSVNINSESAEILRRVTAERGITTTEAVRRAIGLLGFFEETLKNGSKILVEDKDKHQSILQPIY